MTRTGRPRIDPYWEQEVRIITENEPRLGPKPIRARLEKSDKAKDGTLRVPSLRAIGRLQREFRGWREEDRVPYRRFKWPESMGGSLGWAAGAAALELVRYCRQHGFPPPLIGQARWFSRITALAPDAPFGDRHQAALILLAQEMAGGAVVDDRVSRSVEMWLAFTPWRSEGDAKAYEAALGDAQPFPPFLRVHGDATTLADVLGAFNVVGMSPPAVRAAAKFIYERHGREPEEEEE